MLKVFTYSALLCRVRRGKRGPNGIKQNKQGNKTRIPRIRWIPSSAARRSQNSVCQCCSSCPFQKCTGGEEPLSSVSVVERVMKSRCEGSAGVIGLGQCSVAPRCSKVSAAIENRRVKRYDSPSSSRSSPSSSASPPLLYASSPHRRQCSC